MRTKFLGVLLIASAASLAGCAPYPAYSGGYSSSGYGYGYGYGYPSYSAYDDYGREQWGREQWRRQHQARERERERNREEKARGRRDNRQATKPSDPTPEELAAAIRKKFD